MTTNSTFERSSVNQLLSQVARIKANNDRITKLKKESFNIFSLLRKEHDEVYLHSAFIADLLNPRGTHQMGPAFLELFFQDTGLAFPVTAHTVVEAEKVLPECRADIYLRSGQRECIIENKIYAGDQENQLGRNRDYLHARDPQGSLLLYLTLDGRASDDAQAWQGSGEPPTWYQQISYRVHVLEWLDRCRRKAVDHPALRETLKQYIFLVRKLTGQLTTDEMTEELKTAIRDNFLAADLISKEIDMVKQEAVAKFFDDLTTTLTETLGDGWTVNAYGHSPEAMVSKRYTSLAITHQSWPREVNMEVQGQPTSVADQTIYGITGNKKQISRDMLERQLTDVEFFKQKKSTNEWWVCRDTLFNFGNPEEAARLFDQNKRKELLTSTAKKVMNLCKSCAPRLAAGFTGNQT